MTGLFRIRFRISFIVSLYLFISALLPYSSFATDFQEKMHFENLSVKNGLSSNIINRICEDSYGFIWIATPNGLNRYNGTSVTAFYHSASDSGTLPGNGILSIAVDKRNLWVGTSKGLCRFNYETEKFESHLQAGPAELNSIPSLFVDSKERLWVGTENGLFRFDQKENIFIKIITDEEINLNAPLCFAEYSDGTILAGTWEKGFYCINENNRFNTRDVISFGGNRPTEGFNTIESILIDKNNTIWLSTRRGVVKANQTFEMGISKYKYSLFQDDLSASDILMEPSTHALCEDDNGRIWIGTENGLGVYNPLTQKISLYHNDPSDPYSLTNNHIKCIFKDSNGNLWFGTYQGGLNIYHPDQNYFRDHFSVINNSADQRVRYVKSIFQDKKGIIWIGTDFGLLKFSEKGQLLHTYVNNPNDPQSINIGGVSAILEDFNNRFWIGTWGGGLHEMNRETGKFVRLPYTDKVFDNPKSLGDVTISSIAIDSRGNLWIGNIRGFLDKYNPETKLFEHYQITIEGSEIKAIIEDIQVDKDDNVWVCTRGSGLIVIPKNSKKPLSFNSYSSPDSSSSYPELNTADVYSVYFSDDEQVWIGTSGGVRVYDIKGNTLKSFTTNDGLPSNLVYNISADDLGNIWMSTLNGISRYNPVTKAFINYDGREGIKINSECGFKSSTGWLFFGGVNGINAINPSEIKGNNVIPQIVFTDFKIFNKSVEIGINSILQKHINFTDEIVINHNQNVFSIEFAALSFINTEKNQFKCRLEGFDKDWVFLGSANEARYTNLSPGDYSFHLIACNNDGIWNQQGRILIIKVLPPWYKTWWFKMLIILALFLIILAWLLVRTYNLRDQQKKLKQLVFERTTEIESQKIKLQEQANILIQTNHLLLEKQNEISAQNEAIAIQKEKLEVKNELLEEQKSKISEQMLREQEMAEKLHKLDQLKLHFFTNISHEFRTPLTLILGPIEKLLSDFSSNSEFTDLGKVIQRNTLRLLNLINQFLDISRFESGVVKLTISRGDIFTYINGIVNAYRFAAVQKKIEINYRSDIDSCDCFFDADKIEKILYNLLSNAFKFTPPNGRIDVMVNFLNKGNNKPGESETIRISVSDNGKGIPSEYQSKIFERFYQVETDGNEHVSGTGIGLALTSDLVSIYRGTIEVESVPGEGTTFVVCLPVDKSSFKAEEFSTGLPLVDDFKHQLITVEDHDFNISDLVDNSNEKVNPETVHTDDRPAVLVVDDSRDIRNYLADQLGQEFKIIEANNGNDGLEMAIKHLPKLVIADVMMSGMNGYELCARLKTDLLTCHIPVIILTAKVSPEDQLESIETGADAYISKPFNIRLLQTQIRQLITSREQLKHLFRRELTIGPNDIVVESSDEKLMNRIINTMSDNISNPDFGVEELGREVGLSRTHLYRKIKQLTNHTAIEFVRNMRLQRAAQLFNQNKLYVAEVAYMCGFKELSYFRKIFKEFYGMSPQKYINNCIEKAAS